MSDRQMLSPDRRPRRLEMLSDAVTMVVVEEVGAQGVVSVAMMQIAVVEELRMDWVVVG